jgi:hypothetical protein
VPGGEEWGLYDLDRDKQELYNEYSNPEYASVIEALKAELPALHDTYEVVDIPQEVRADKNTNKKSPEKKMNAITLALMGTGMFASICNAEPAVAVTVEQLPNILFILADDLGYGDVGCYNPESKVPTPNLDRLAAEGMRFTDAHSPATVCTPTRYSILTGRMQFRTGMKGVFTGAGGPCLIEERRLTLPQMLRDKGYSTACIGKWHIGMSFFDKEGKRITDQRLEGVRQIDYTRPIPDGPVHRGFDRFFGTVCCPTTDWLYAFVDGDRIPVPPTKVIDRSTLPKHPFSRDCRPGMVADNFNHEEVDLVFLRKSREFLEQHVKTSPDKPFFLYHSICLRIRRNSSRARLRRDPMAILFSKWIIS